MSQAFITPRGFHSVCEDINIIAKDDEKILFALIDVVYQLQSIPDQNTSTPALPPLLQSCSTYNMKMLEGALNGIQHVLIYIFKNFEKNNQDKIKIFLETKTIFTTETITKLLTHYSQLIQNKLTFDHKNNTQENNNQIDSAFNIQWKIGLMIASSNCQQLYSPYVSLSIDVDSIYQSFEFNLSEFAQFSQKITEIQEAFRD
jgi:hypothetical protein